MYAYTHGTFQARNEIIIGSENYAMAMNCITTQRGSRRPHHVLCGR